MYEELLIAVINRCNTLGFQLDPTTVITDYEKASINAISSTLGPHVRCQGCFYHLTQSTWRKIQSLGLVTTYRSDEDVKLFCGILDGLAFLPVDDVAASLDQLKENIPEGLDDLVAYFEATYVNGTCRKLQRPPCLDGRIPPIRMRRIPPLFPAELWNVHLTTLGGGSRTNNLCEAWNRAFSSLLRISHPTIWRALEHLCLDHSNVKTALLQYSRGQPPKKLVRKATKDLQERLYNLCASYDDNHVYVRAP
ncbi:hypothetical protein SNE40_018439 [Patella caerulea]|uniref:MULE transposase domain-containing protein n=1 Tax=Patella caerulea TaxID=87958 RepID=A0AAN8P7Y9_PATCE